MSQKYVVVNFFDPFGVGYNFPKEDWMPHVTLMPLFSTDNIDEVSVKLSKIAKSSKPFEVRVTGQDMFGPKKDKPVALLSLPYPLSSLHTVLINIPGCKFESPQYNGNGYRPHITLQKNHDIHINDKYTISCLTLVDMYPDKDINRRQIMANFRLGHD